MKANLITTLLIWCCIACTVSNGFGQYPTAPGTQPSAAIVQFDKAIGQQSLLYNGPAYDAGRKIKNNPTFHDTTGTSIGWVMYDGFIYKNVPLLYDTYQDVAVSIWVDGESKYCFLSNKLSEFNLMGHHFIRLLPDSAGRKVLKGGFYDVAYNNKLQVLVKEVKIKNVADDFYETHTYYYLKKDGLYYEVSGLGDMYGILKDREDELKKYLKGFTVSFGKQPRETMVFLATYYDKITN